MTSQRTHRWLRHALLTMAVLLAALQAPSANESHEPVGVPNEANVIADIV